MTPELKAFFDNLPPHIKPANDTERLKMTFAWFEGHTEGMRVISATVDEALLRTVPLETKYDFDRGIWKEHEPDAKSASDSINRENAAAINRKGEHR